MPFELFKNIGKTLISSVPVLSVGPLYFLLSTLLAALGFSHFGEVPLEFCSAHAGSVHGRMRRCISRRALKYESFFESRESPKHWGFEWPLFGTDPHPWRR